MKDANNTLIKIKELIKTAAGGEKIEYPEGFDSKFNNLFNNNEAFKNIFLQVADVKNTNAKKVTSDISSLITQIIFSKGGFSLLGIIKELFGKELMKKVSGIKKS